MKSVTLLPVLIAHYPGEALLCVLSKEQLGLLLMAFYIAAFIALITVMLRCGKAKTKSKPTE